MSLLHIIVTGEDSTLRDALSRAIRPLPCIVVQAGSGGELERLLLGRERFDLVIADLRQVGAAGIEAAERGRRLGFATPIIFVVERDDESLARPVSALGDAVLLAAPTRAELVAQIRRSLGSRLEAR